MTAGPVNRALLESNFQNPGDVYSDLKTEGAFDVVADAIDDNWDYTTTLVANGTLSPYPSFLSRQAIINGNFDVWQRGTSFSTPSSATYTADRFQNFYNGTSGTFSISRSPVIVGDTNFIQGTKFLLTYNQTVAGSGGTFKTINQKIENVRLFAGQQCAISFLAIADAPRTMSATLRQNFGTGGSPSASVDTNSTSFNLTTSWQTFTYTFTLPSISGKTLGTNGDDNLEIILFFPINTVMTISIAQLQLNAGAVALPFQPRSFAEELALCQRFYEKSYDIGTLLGTTANANGATSINAGSIIPIIFKTRKRIAPTMTYYSTNTGATGKARDSTAAQDVNATTGNSGESAITINAAPITSGNTVSVHWSADSEL